MLPNSANHNQPNRVVRDTEQLREFMVWRAFTGALAYVFHLLWSELNLAVWLVPFCNHISGVFSARSEEQVIGAHTGANVARMADKHASWYRTVMYLPRHAVCLVATSITFLGVYQYLAVAIRFGTASPQPACIGFLNFRPEAGGEWRNWKRALVRVVARSAAKPPCGLVGYVAERLKGKRFAAFFANTFGGRIEGHRKASLSGVMPRAVTAAPWFHYTTKQPFTAIASGKGLFACLGA